MVACMGGALWCDVLVCFLFLLVEFGSLVNVRGRFAGDRRSEWPGVHRGEGETVGDRYNPSRCQPRAARTCIARHQGRESRWQKSSTGGARGIHSEGTRIETRT